MNNIKNIGFATFFTALATAACGQEDVVWPDGGLSSSDECSECDSLYPGPVEEGSYALETDAVLPCFAWESARVNNTDTIINIDYEYLSALIEADNDNRAVVIVVSAQNCGPCAVLINDIASKAAEFELAGAFFMGAAYTDMSDGAVVLDLETAEHVLEEENWPMQWPLTNDEEKHLRSLGSEFPQLVVIRMNDMMVYSIGNGVFGGTNGYGSVEELLTTIQSFPDVTAK